MHRSRSHTSRIPTDRDDENLCSRIFGVASIHVSWSHSNSPPSLPLLRLFVFDVFGELFLGSGVIFMSSGGKVIIDSQFLWQKVVRRNQEWEEMYWWGLWEQVVVIRFNESHWLLTDQQPMGDDTQVNLHNAQATAWACGSQPHRKLGWAASLNKPSRRPSSGLAFDSQLRQLTAFGPGLDITTLDDIGTVFCSSISHHYILFQYWSKCGHSHGLHIVWCSVLI